jgi:hypothetical protein
MNHLETTKELEAKIVKLENQLKQAKSTIFDWEVWSRRWQ